MIALRHELPRGAGSGAVAKRGARRTSTVVRAALTLALAGLLAACATAPRTRAIHAATGRTIAAVAASLIGTPYRFGGADDRGFDCSGLAVYAYQRVGIVIPRSAAEQRRTARRVPLARLLPGDLVFFRIGARRVNHVGIYVGGGRFIHAPRSGALVSYASLLQGFYRRHLVGAGSFWR